MSVTFSIEELHIFENRVALKTKRSLIESVANKIKDGATQRKELTFSNSKNKRNLTVVEDRVGSKKLIGRKIHEGSFNLIATDPHKKITKFLETKSSIESARRRLNYQMIQLKQQHTGLLDLCGTMDSINLQLNSTKHALVAITSQVEPGLYLTFDELT